MRTMTMVQPTVTTTPCLSTAGPGGMHQQRKARVQMRSDRVGRQRNQLGLRLGVQRKAGAIFRGEVGARGCFKR